MVRHIKDVVFEFFGYTTLHGLARFAAARFIVQRVFWALMFLLASGFCFFQMYRLAIQYQAKETSTKIVMDYKALDFPDVTMCNLNPASYTKVKGIKELYQVLQEAADRSNLSSLVPPLFNYADDIDWPNRTASLVEMRQLFLARMGNQTIVTESVLRDRLPPFFRSCTFRGVNCTGSDFQTVWDDLFGYCYTYKPSKSITVGGASDADKCFWDNSAYRGKFKMAAKCLPPIGLRLEIDVQVEDYLPFIGDSEGVVIDLKRRGDVPTPKNTGISVSPGYHTSIALSLKENVRVPGEQGVCTEDSEMYNDRAHCIELCYASTSATLCGCVPGYTYATSSVGVCQTFNDLSCYNGIVSSYNIWTYCSHCKDLCRTVEYNPAISMKLWYSLSTQKLLDEQDRQNGLSHISYSSLQQSIIDLNIYYTSLTTESVIEEVPYTMENFISDIGGNLGLLIGLSVLTLGEMLELILIILIGFCRERK